MTIYRVNNMYVSVQGEGTLTGVPMVVLRLQGCAVGCPFCDTRETWAVDSALRAPSLPDAWNVPAKWAEADAAEIVLTIQDVFPGPRWIMVTGGEPAAQPLGELVERLHGAGYRVALETSGTATGHLDAGFDWVCVSPKIDMPGGLPVLAEALASANEIKHVVGRASDITALDALLTEHASVLKDDVTICLQPMSLNERATNLCIKTATERGWRLSIQVHRLISVP